VAPKELVSERLDHAHYFVHVSAVEPFFTVEERPNHITVIEEKHGVTRFCFDLPLSESVSSSIKHCWLKRMIFPLPSARPYSNSRLTSSAGRLRKLEYSPIEYDRETLCPKVDHVEEARVRGEIKALQPLLQGSLIIQANEHSKTMAEVFLAGAAENEYIMSLRAIFIRRKA
jgi:hypothetical protein